MIFNRHANLEGTHAPFGASKSSWLRYDDEKTLEVFKNLKAAEMGTKLHEWAKMTIDLGIKQPKSKKTIYNYINDAIGYRMNTEVVLYYSPYFYGTADSICFRNNILRIHDLKTGIIPAHMEQLEIYAALFCLEYNIKPASLKEIHLQIYQNDEVLCHEPSADDIQHIMDKIVHINKILIENEGGVQ
jgi:hypothetical protein